MYFFKLLLMDEIVRVKGNTIRINDFISYSFSYSSYQTDRKGSCKQQLCI